ncbi:hypothetical protein [Sphingomonas profundi]|uniref:hypothetical protein n=1 Tax=Alterirhizorhabdus profundi TaxID=2681549 RepID=UPI0012E7B083|nr:hypothetical protein [Sphingomonas profundi]
MGTIDRYDDRAAVRAALGFRPLATLNAFVAWWGQHRAWPANEPARIPPESARAAAPARCR